MSDIFQNTSEIIFLRQHTLKKHNITGRKIPVMFFYALPVFSLAAHTASQAQIFILSLHVFCKRTINLSIMSKYNFNTVIDRRGTDSVSLEGMKRQTGRDDLMPMWVADMGFATPPFVFKAIEKRLGQQILGYTCAPERYYTAIEEWNKKRFGMDTPGKTIHYIPGIVPGLAFAVNALTEKGNGVMIMTPVYHPFNHVTVTSGRTLVEVPLKLVDGRYEMDYENIDRRLPECKMLILCNPHNPGGTSWSEDELRRLADLCAKHHVIIVSDEIHADLTLAGHKHVMMASVSDTARDITVTMMAPTKAFNLPGVVASHTIIFNDSLRRRFFSYLDGNDLGLGNVFAYDCVCACYSAEGEEWLNEMLGYVQENISYVLSFLSQHCPKITAIRPEASFLVFLDNHKLGLESQKEIVDFYINDARLFLNDGEMFGAPGRGYMRMNVAQPRCVIEKAMNQLAEAYRKRGFDK